MLNLSKSQNLQEDSDHLINSESGICTAMGLRKPAGF